MMSNIVRGRRVTEPVLIQRGPSPFDKHEDFTAVWDQMGEAKTALRRAERRLEEAENRQMEPFSPLSQEYSQAKKYHSSDKIVTVDRVPSYEVGKSTFKTPDSKSKYSRDYERDTTVPKKVTIKDVQDFTSKDSRLTSGYRSRSPVPNYGVLETRGRHEMNGNAYLDRDSDWLNSDKYLGRDVTDRGRFTLKDSDKDKQAVAKISDYDAYDDFNSKYYSSPNYHERSTSAIDDSTEIRVLNDIPHKYSNGEFSRKTASQTDFTSAYSRLYGHEPGDQNNVATSRNSSPRFDSKGLSKVREQIERQRQLKTSDNKDDYVNRPRHRDTDPVNFIPSVDVYHVPETSVLSSKQPKVRKVATAPPAPTYKGFNQVETKILAGGKLYRDGEMKRKTRTKTPGQEIRKADSALRPHRTTQKITKPTVGAIEDKKKMTRKVQRISAPMDKKPHRTDRQGTISARSWREGQKVTRRVLGPPPKKHRSQVTQIKEEHVHMSDDDDDDDAELMKKIEEIPERQDRKDESDEEISQHTIESDKPGKTHALSEEAKDVLDDLHLDKSDSEDSDHEKMAAQTKARPEKRKQGSGLKKKSSKPTEPQYPTHKVRSYDSDEVRKFMVKQQADRKKKQQEVKKQQLLAEEKQKRQLEDLYKKQKQSVKTNEKKKNYGRKRMDETFSKGPYLMEDLPKHHPFPTDRKRVELSGSDKENKGLWSASSSSHSDESVIPSTPRSGSPRVGGVDIGQKLTDRMTSPQLNASDSQDTKDVPVDIVRTGSPLHHRDNLYMKTRPAPRTSSTDNLTLGIEREFDRQDLIRRPYSSSMTDLRFKGYGGSRSAGSRSKAERLAAIKDMASALQGRIEAEARRLAGGLDSSANKSVLDRGERWAYSPRSPMVTIPDDVDKPPRYERITGRLADHAVFTSDLPGVGSLSSHAMLSSEIEKENEAATKIQAAYRGHHVRQGLMWKLPSGLTLGQTIHGKDEDLPIKYLSGGLDQSPNNSDDEFISEDTLTEDNKGPKFRDLLGGVDHQRLERPADLDLHRDLLTMSANRRDFLRSPYGQPKPDGLSVIDIYTRRYEEAVRDPTRKYKDHGMPTEPSISHAYSYDDDFTDASVSKTQGLSHKSSPGTHGSPKDKSYPISQRSLSKAMTYSDDFTSSASTQSKKSGSEKTPKVRGQTKRSSEKKSPRSLREDTLEEVSYSQSFSSSEEDGLKASMKRSRTPSPRTVSGKSALARTKSPDVTGTRSPIDRKSPISRSDTQSPITLTDRPSPVSERKSPTSGSLRKSPVSRDHGNGFQPVEDVVDERDEELEMEAARRRTRGDTREQRVYRPVPYGLGRQVTDGPPRLAPSALELKMAAELNLLESMEESMRQLTEVERTRAVSLAQQESVSLAQILKARQQSHERELQLLSMKARQEAEEASRQLEEARLRAAAAAAQAEKTLAQVKKEATDSVNETAQKLMQSQAEAAKVTAEAAKQLAGARHASLEHVAAMQKFDPTKVASDTASAAAAAAVTAALEKQRQQQLERWKEIRAKKAKALSDYSTSSGATTSRTDSQTPTSSKYSSDFTDYTTSKSKDKALSSSPSYSERYRSDRSPPKDKDRKDKDMSISESVKTAEDMSRNERQRDRGDISTASSIQTAADTARSNSNSTVKTASGLSIDRDNSEKDDDLSIQTDPSISIAKDSSKSESIAEDISISKGSEDYSMQFDSHTEDDIEEKSFRMLLPSESHRRHSSKGRHGSQSDHASSSDEMTLTNDSGKWPVDDMRSPFSAEESFNKFTAEMVKQYMREEELRAQHQAALLRLREKALKEKTKAEMAWIEHQKKRLKDKGTDEAMPPLRKKQRGLLMKLKQEQAEIERLKAANKAASQERKLLLYQQQEISRIRKSAQAYWGRVKGSKTVPDDARSEDDISIGLDDSISDVVDGLSDLSSPSPTKLDRDELLRLRDSKLDDSQLSASEKQAKVMQKLKKMKTQSNEKFLTRREQKLLKKHKAKAKKKLDEEEMRVQNMEKEALKLLEEKAKAAKEGKPTDRKQKKDTEEKDDKSPRKDSKISEKDESSITEEISQVSSIPEDIPSESPTDKNSFPVQTGNGFSSDDTTITEDYANEKFESVDTSVTATNRTLSVSPRAKTPRSLSSLSIRYPLSPVRTRRDEESGSEESFSLTQSETTSDLSDVEGRIAALKDALRKRKIEVERLRKQQKKRHRERLRAQEASLKKQLETYEKYIEKTKAELVTEREPDKNTVKPQIKQPKAAESKRIKEQISPRQQKQKPEPDSPIQTSPEKKSEIDTSNKFATDDQSVKDVTDSYTPFSATTPAATPVPTEDIQTSEASQKRRTLVPRKERSYKEDSFSDSISIILGPKGPEVISPRPPPPRSQSPDSRPGSNLSDYTDASEILEDLPSARSVKSGISDFLTPRLPDIQEKSDISTETADPSQRGQSQSDIAEEVPSQTQDSEIAEDVLSGVSTRSSQPEISPRISLKQRTEESAVTQRKEDNKPTVTESPDKSSASVKTPSPEKSTDLDKSFSPDKSQEQSFQTSLSQDRSELSESERSVSSTRSKSQSKSYSYSEDFTETSSPRSETEDEISEHLSESSVQSFSEKSAELIIDLKQADLSKKDYEPEKEVSEEKEGEDIVLEPVQDDKEVDRESGTITPVDDDRTPIASPTPQEDLEEFRVGDRVLVGDKQPGTLRFKGTTSFAPGIWGGVELDAPKGTNDGSLDGHVYFKSEPGYGIFAPPHKLSLMPDDYRYEETESEIESIEDEIKGSPERTSQEHGILEEEDMYRYETSESSVSKQTIKSATEGKKEISDLDSTMDDSELERIITHSAAAVEAFSKSPQTSVDEGEHSQEDAVPLPLEEENGRQNLEEIVDNITDQLTTVVVKDTLSHLTNLTDKKTPLTESEKGRTPLLEMLVEDKEGVDEKATVPEVDTTPKRKTQPSDSVVNNLTKTLLTEAVAQMQAIRRQKDQKVASQNVSFEDEEGRVTPITDIEPPPLVSSTPSPERDQASPISPLPPIRAETPYTPSPVDMSRKDDDEEPLSDEMFNERVKVEDANDDTAFPEPVARPSSPVPGESGDTSWKTLDDDLADVLGDEGEWFDDDFGSMPRSNSIVKVPQRQDKDLGISQDRVSAGEITHDIHHVDLQKLAEELFYAVPHNQKEVLELCAEALKIFYEKQENGEPLTKVSVPESFLGSDTKGTDIESVSRKAYKDMVFHLTGEVFKDIYCEDYNTNRPSWMKPKRVIRKYYHKPKPPDSYSELDTIVRENVLYLLGLQRKPQSDLISLKWINKKKKDHVDEILTEELREEEPEWVNYDDDELAVKMQLADSIMESLLTDTIMVLSTVHDRRKARQEGDVPITTI
ncbi:centrosome-associated protein 350-like [Glandiceps talaboti]